ncbi:HD superfamily phosphohydrolases [Cenarchaeum symbiosum A]|uniref:HD superfamily phosphohydrolases n=1 Tax=Cenarchaeum symbiosum (strain A) TaxID=414004 RepID=A0RXT5_CENSY|nr:HD superfamily phosphohydrolases [Cenarchaeum symbiosum A]
MRGHLDIIDPVHGFVSVSGAEVELIDLPAFQRLRRIRQLSGAHLVYPGAQHTRFEHSLGVMHVAGQMARFLGDRGILGPGEAEALRLSSLLHDIGHGPFSHLFEEVYRRGSGFSHEDMGRKIIEETEVGDVLEASGHAKKTVAGLAFGGPGPKYAAEIVSGALSADIMDYLPRDGHFTGAEHARIDSRRIVQSLDVYGDRLALERSALYSFESMMHSRYQMFKAVYFHKTVRAAEVILLEAMELAEGELGLTSGGLDDYLGLTDEAVLSGLLSLEGGGDPGRARAFAEDYLNRRLPKCVYERIKPVPGGTGVVDTAGIRGEISRKSGVDPSEIFVDDSMAPSVPLPPKDVRQSVMLMDHGRNVKEVPMQEMPLVAAMSEFTDILRVYATSGARNKVEIAARSILGER